MPQPPQNTGLVEVRSDLTVVEIRTHRYQTNSMVPANVTRDPERLRAYLDSHRGEWIDALDPEMHEVHSMVHLAAATPLDDIEPLR